MGTKSGLRRETAFAEGCSSVLRRDASEIWMRLSNGRSKFKDQKNRT
jgi:hypothetical protein